MPAFPVDEFFSLSSFAMAATHTDAQSVTHDVAVIYNEPASDTQLFGTAVQNTSPTVTMRDADAYDANRTPTVTNKSTIAIHQLWIDELGNLLTDELGNLLLISGAIIFNIKHIGPQGAGVTEVELSEDTTG